MIDPNLIRQEYIDIGETWADKNGAACLLEETKATLFAKLARESNEPTAARAEWWAKSHPDYQAHVRSMVEARGAADRAKVHYDALRAHLDMLRTVESTKRAEMGLR